MPSARSIWRSEISGPRSGSPAPGPIVTASSAATTTRHGLVVDRALDQQPRAGGAALAGVLDQRADDRGDGGVEVGVGEDDVGRLAAELQLDRREPARARLGDQRAGRGGADERHVVDARVLGERGPGRAVPGRDLDHPARDARGLGQLGEPQRRDRGQLRGLDDHRVARRQRRRGAAGHDLQRVVPRDDLRAHAPGLAHGVVQDVRARAGSAGPRGARSSPRSSRGSGPSRPRRHGPARAACRCRASRARRARRRRPRRRGRAAPAPARARTACAIRARPRARDGRRRRTPPPPPASSRGAPRTRARSTGRWR